VRPWKFKTRLGTYFGENGRRQKKIKDFLEKYKQNEIFYVRNTKVSRTPWPNQMKKVDLHINHYIRLVGLFLISASILKNSDINSDFFLRNNLYPNHNILPILIFWELH